MTDPNDLPHPIVINFRTGKSRLATVAEAAKYKAEQEAATIVKYETVPNIDSESDGWVQFTIYGEPASKANSRRIVFNPMSLKPMVVKSKKALTYWHHATLQLPRIKPLEGALKVTMQLFYANERSDLDESVLLDLMQNRYTGKGKERRLCWTGIYDNDRQVRERHVYHRIDAANPRAVILVERI